MTSTRISGKDGFTLSFSRQGQARDGLWHVAVNGILIWATATRNWVNGGWDVSGGAGDKVGHGTTRKAAAVSYLITNKIVEF